MKKRDLPLMLHMNILDVAGMWHKLTDMFAKLVHVLKVGGVLSTCMTNCFLLNAHSLKRSVMTHLACHGANEALRGLPFMDPSSTSSESTTCQNTC